MSELSIPLAYIGPGLGVGTFVVVLAVMVSVLFAFCAIVWYPLKRALKRFKCCSPNHVSDELAEPFPTSADNHERKKKDDRDQSLLGEETS